MSKPARPPKPLATPAPGAEPQGWTGQGWRAGTCADSRACTLSISLSLTHSLTLARSLARSLSLALSCLHLPHSRSLARSLSFAHSLFLALAPTPSLPPTLTSLSSREPFLSLGCPRAIAPPVAHPPHLYYALAVLDDGRVLWHRCWPAKPENRFQGRHCAPRTHGSVVTWLVARDRSSKGRR